MDNIKSGVIRIAEGVAAGFGATASVDFRLIFAPLINQATQTCIIADAAAELVGENAVERNKPAGMGSEDFAFMMERVPGAYINLGNGESSAQLHNHSYDFNDDTTPYGAAMFARLVERSLPAGMS
jgi:hippurate hydrolase